MTRARELANFADDTAGLETLTVSDITDLSVSASNINSATNQITDSSTDLNVDSNTLVVDKSTDRVGIGASPSFAPLELKQSNTTYGFLIEASGNDAWIRLHHNDSVGILETTYNSSAGHKPLTFKTGGAERLRIDTSGNVGINCDPSAKLSVLVAEDTVYANVAPNVSDAILSLANIQTSEAVNDQAQIQFNVNGGTHNRVGSVGLVAESTSNRKASLVFTTDEGSNRDEKMRITGDGNVGIGTSVPDGNLEVAGSQTTNGVHFKTGGGSTNAYIFKTSNYAGTEYFRIHSDGKVGIGTDNPSSTRRVHIKNTDDTRGLYIENTDSSSYAEVHLKASREFRIGTGNSSSDVQARDRFYIYDATANAHRFTLDASGKVGIGTSSPDATILTGKTTGSNNANMYLGATGTGNAEIVLDGSNGDFAGSDYYIFRQLNSTLDVENWLGISGDYIWKTNAGTERVRLKNNGTLQHVSGTTQLGHEQYSYGTSSFASNGNWHTMLSGLSGHHVFLVRMYQSGSGFHTSALFIAANTYASGNIWTFSSGSGWSSNLELRWTGSTYNYNLEGRSTGTNSALTYWRIKLINI